MVALVREFSVMQSKACMSLVHQGKEKEREKRWKGGKAGTLGRGSRYFACQELGDFIVK